MTANQKYKESGTKKPFKQWLVEEQKKGELEIHDSNEYNNAVGTQDIIRKSNNRTRNVLIAVGVSVAIYGIYRLYKSKSE